MFLNQCPECSSLDKSVRGMVWTLAHGKVFCANNWHWSKLELSAGNGMMPPRGWEWNANDDVFMSLMNLAFSKPLSYIQKEYYYLGLNSIK